MKAIPRAQDLSVVACTHCRLVCEDILDDYPAARCARCNTPLRRRRPPNAQRAWAFLIAAMTLYIPANVLPVMYTRMLNNGADSTIVGGIVDFWRAGSYGMALVIFVASVAVPCCKFAVMGFLLIASRRRMYDSPKQHTRLYRLLEWIGYWSMLDVLVVAWGSAIGNFGALSGAEPRIGILFFGLVVVLTILSTISFDPRLIWDAKKHG